MTHSPKNFRPQVERLESRDGPSIAPISGAAAAFGFSDVHKQVEQTLSPALIGSQSELADDAMLHSIARVTEGDTQKTLKRMRAPGVAALPMPKLPLGSKLNADWLAEYFRAGVVGRTTMGASLSPDEQSFIRELESWAQRTGVDLTYAKSNAYEVLELR